MANNQNKELLLNKISIQDLNNLCAIYNLKIESNTFMHKGIKQWKK